MGREQRAGEVQQFVDEQVSRSKFEREVAEFTHQEAIFRRRGWLMLRAEFPQVLVAFCATNLRPTPVVTGVLLDYTNYDAQPPSFTMVDPFTEEPFLGPDLPTILRRQGSTHQVALPGLPPGAMMTVPQETPLMQWHSADSRPFLCVPGVREYHDHPAHSGDRWELHRTTGAGKLVRLLQVVDTYGLQPITDFQLQLKMEVAGFVQGQPPT